MLSKNKIKNIRALHITKYRKERKLFIVETPKVVSEFLHSSFVVKEIFATDNWLENELSVQGIPINRITEKELHSISALTNANQVFALVQIPDYANIKFNAQELILALDTIQDPGNMGTIIRIADWFGIKKIVCSKESADVYNPKVVQASMGALSRIQIHYTELVPWLSQQDATTPIYGTLLNGEDIYSQELSQRGVIIIGNESKGINPMVQNMLSHRIRIPSYGNSKMESLNAAIATAIVCAEFKRPKR